MQKQEHAYIARHNLKRSQAHQLLKSSEYKSADFYDFTTLQRILFTATKQVTPLTCGKDPSHIVLLC